MTEPIKIGKKDFRPGNTFEVDLENKFKSGILFGEHGFDLLKHVKFNTEDKTLPRYAKGPFLRNFSAQYFLIEFPDIAVGTFQGLRISHDLQRVPSGAIVVASIGVDLTVFPFTLLNIVPGLMYGSITEQSVGVVPSVWTDKQIQINETKIVGSAGSIRMVIMVF